MSDWLTKAAAKGVKKKHNAGGASVIDEIAAERKRQIEVEGFSLDHDDGYVKNELALAAISYALNLNGIFRHNPPDYWRWARRWWKPKDRRRDLIRAGALIVAEIERLDRAEAQNNAP